jgi:putative serine protease PepD
VHHVTSSEPNRPAGRPIARRCRESLVALVLGLTVGLGVLVATGVPEAGGDRGNPAAAAAAPAVADGVQLDPSVPDVEAIDVFVGDRVRAAEVAGCGGRREGTVVLAGGDGVDRWWTNRHVAAGASSLELLPGGTRPVVGATVGFDAATVLASVDDGSSPGLEIGPAPEAGTGVVVVAYPEGGRSVAVGRVLALERRSDRGMPTAVVLVDVPAGPGSSGGAVVDGAGRLVGLVAARDPRTGWTVAHPMADLALADVDSGPPPC